MCLICTGHLTFVNITRDLHDMLRVLYDGQRAFDMCPHHATCQNLA